MHWHHTKITGLRAQDIEYADGYGGVRPQLIDKACRELRMGETKIIAGDRIVFNMTPSPGGTSCLGNAEADMRLGARHLGCRIDERAFEAERLTGHEDTRACLDPLVESA